MATYKAIKDPGITWSSEPYGTTPAMSAGAGGGGIAGSCLTMWIAANPADENGDTPWR